MSDRVLPPGPFRRALALALGFSADDIAAALKSGRWKVLRRGVYVTAADRAAAAASPQTLHAQDVAALLLALRRMHIAAAESSAGRIYGLEFLKQPQKGLIVCTDDPGVSGTHKSNYFLRCAPLPADQFRLRYGVPITSPARTVLDLAANLDFPGALVVAESALRKKLLVPAELEKILALTDNRPGIQVARAALPFADPKTQSVLESVSRASMRTGGIRIPECQKVVYVNGRRYEVDFYWDHLGVDVFGEGDGLDKSLGGDDRRTTMERLRDEKQRERDLLDTGAEVVRWGMAEARDPHRLAARLNGSFARATERARGRAN